MNSSKLIRNAESIASNLSAYPQAQQIDKIVEHLQLFWSLPMQQHILSLSQQQKTQLPKTLQHALQRLQQSLQQKKS